MFKIFTLVSLIVLFIVVVFSWKNLEAPAFEPEATPQGAVLSRSSSPKIAIELNGHGYGVYWIEVDTVKTTLIPNFAAKRTSNSAFEEYGCKTIINGGFYAAGAHGPEPIGYFLASRAELSGFVRNRLFDGVLSLNELDTPRITREVPADPLVNAIQTGPIVWENGSEAKLSLVRDEHKRRMVAGVTGENKLIFMAIYSADSVFAGPKLAELPGIIAKLNVKEEMGLADVINLDGGSASALVTPEFSLSEASPVGSFFCAK